MAFCPLSMAFVSKRIPLVIITYCRNHYTLGKDKVGDKFISSFKIDLHLCLQIDLHFILEIRKLYNSNTSKYVLSLLT